MENEEEDGHDRRISKEYCNILHDRSMCDNNALPNVDGIKSLQANKHSYFLRAKGPRLMRFHLSSDHEEGRASSSSICKSFLSRSRVSYKSDECSEEEDLANCLVMLSNNKSTACGGDQKDKEIVMEKGMFQCKACKKIFNSHQALGGHRASHKKVKGCFASKLDGINDDDEDEEINGGDHKEEMPSELDAEMSSARKRVTKMHECSVCRRVFSSGQALGGHKRCHWLTTSTDNAFIPNFQYHDHYNHTQQLCKKPAAMLIPKPPTHHEHVYDHRLDLNLNLPPPPSPQPDLSHRDPDIINKTSKCEASTRLCLQQWVNHNQQKNHEKEKIIEKNGENGCGMKLRKLSDLRDVNIDGGWLQMGINASTSTEMRL